MLFAKPKTIYVTQTVTELDEEGKEIQKEVQVPQKIMAYYRNDTEITEEQYDAIIASLPKPKEPTQEQIEAQQRIEELKSKLSESDYKAIKFAEGILNVVEYAPIRAERQAMRDEINRLEELLK